MKKALYILVFVFYALSNAQTYTFDYILKYESTTKTPKFPVKHIYHIAINSANPDYFFIFSSSGNGVLKNLKKNEKYYFSIKEIDDGNYELKYLETHKQSKNKKSYHYNAQLNENSEFKFQTFTNKRKGKISSDVVMKLKESPYNFLFVEGDHIYQEEEVFLTELQSSLDSTKSYIMESIKINHSDGYIFTCNFISSEKFNIEITVPFNK